MLWLVEPTDQVYDRAFACAGLSDKRDRFAGTNVQIEIVEQRFCFLVIKVHMVEDNVPVFDFQGHVAL